jgi:hypothetical protein
MREGIQRLQERSLEDLFRHDATSWMDLIHQLHDRTLVLASGCPMVVMVESTHHRKCDHLVACMLRGHG